MHSTEAAMTDTLKERLRAHTVFPCGCTCCEAAAVLETRDATIEELKRENERLKTERDDARTSAAINFEQASGWRENAQAAQARALRVLS